MVRPSFKNTSTGIAPAAAVQALPAKDRQLFLRSTSQESFAGLRHPVPRSCLKYSSQGLGQILHLGEKRTIHAGVPLKVADLAQRSMCEYTSNFREVPLLGASIDRQLAESFRDANRSSQRLAAVPSAKSSYTEAFGPFTRHEQRHARQPACTPAADRRAEDSVGFGSTKSSETSSLAHSSHGKLPLDLLETTSRPVIKDHLGASAQGTKSAFRTTYQSHFKPQTAPASYCRPLLTSQVKFSWAEKSGSGSISDV